MNAREATPGRSKGRKALVGGMAVLVLALGACTGLEESPDETDTGEEEADSTDEVEESESAGQPEEDATLIVATSQGIQTLHPAYYRHRQTQNAIQLVMDVLVDSGGEPRLAESWERVSPTQWEFSLREGVVFHNGETFDARAVEYTWDRLHDPELDSPRAPLDPTFESLEVVDDYTVRFTTSTPDDGYPGARLPLQHILPPEYHDEVGEEAFAEAPIGTGPFVFEEWVPDQRFVAVANDDYWEDGPEVERVILRPIPEQAARIAALQAGEVHIIEGVSVDLAATLSGDVRAESSPGTTMAHIGMNVEEGPFVDRDLRQGMNHAIDQEELSESLYGGFAEPLNQLAFSRMDGYNPDYVGYEYDPELAREMLEPIIDETITIETNPEFAMLADAVAGQLREIELDAQVTVLDAPTLLSRTQAGESPLYLISNGFSASQVSALYVNHFVSERPTRLTNYESDELDARWEELQNLPPEEDPVPHYHELNEFMMDVAPWVPLLNPDLIYGVSNQVEGFEAAPTSRLYLHNVVLRGS